MEKNLFKNKYVAGLTGAIASGKSEAVKMLKGLDFTLVDADIISRKLTSDNAPLTLEIGANFENVVFQGILDRSALRKLVFNDSAMLKKLNNITHPKIKNEVILSIQNAPHGLVILSAPLLFETGLDSVCNSVLTLVCDEKIRIERLIKRDKIDQNLAKKIIASQSKDSYKIKYSDFVVDTAKNFQSIKNELLHIFNIWVESMQKYTLP